MTETRTDVRLSLGRKLWGWLLDYLYAGWWIVRSVVGRTRIDRRLDPPAPVSSPVLLIPGVYENWWFMQPVADHLFARGHPIHVLDQLGFNTRAIADLAAVVGDYLCRRELDDVTIVAHSKGGLIAKQALIDADASTRIRRVVAVNSPFSGSRYAALFLLPSIRMFAPHGPVIRALSLDIAVNRQITSMYSVFDPHVPETGRLEGAENVVLPVVGHFRPLGDRYTLALIADVIARPPGGSTT